MVIGYPEDSFFIESIEGFGAFHFIAFLRHVAVDEGDSLSAALSLSIQLLDQELRNLVDWPLT